MKKTAFSQFLPWLILVSGIVGTGLQFVLFSSSIDERGLLLTDAWADSASWILSALVLLCLLLSLIHI